MEKFLKDIIEIPDIETVINIENIDRKIDEVFSSFILTDDVKNGISIIIEKIKNLKGCGVFVKGNFGSGKSHFLAYLYILLKYKKRVCENLNVIKILLTKYPSSRSLEEIILENFNYKDKVLNRDNVFNKLIKNPTVIIIDELSEFLRSKKNPAEFYEDVRFLQYLGEYSFKNPLWIIASLQEWIEETGYISSSIFNRIKDRYPLRINLTSTHIEDIIDKRIIIKKNNAEKYIEKVYNSFIEYYPNIKISFEKFRKTYPLHPITVRFLSGLSMLFSEHRGVIHFIVSEVKSNLNKSYDYLITADRIYDNFEDRIKEIPDYSPFVNVVMKYYTENISNILKRDKLISTALKLIKILILIEISPIEKRMDYVKLAEIILEKFSTFNENINYEFIKDGILEPLVQNRMFLKKENNIYYIDASINEALKIKADIKREREKFHNREFLFKTILSHLKYNFMPFANYVEGGKAKFLWQNTLREAVIFPVFRPLQNYEIDRFINLLEKKNIDGVLGIVSPFIDDTRWLEVLKEIFNNKFLKLIMFLNPNKFSNKDIDFIEEYFAKINLSKKYRELIDETKKLELEFRELMINKFLNGTIISAEGNEILKLENSGIIPFEKLLGNIFQNPLNEIHPRHYEIMPLIDFIPKSKISSLINDFIIKGKITFKDAEKKGLSNYIEGYLKPLGIIKARGENFYLKIEPENELISDILNIVSQEKDFYNLKIILKKGKWGLTDEQIILLISVLIASGYLIPFDENGEIIEFKDFNEIKTLKTGKSINQKYLAFIKNGNFIWGEVEDVPTFLTQKKMWNSLKNFIRDYRKKLKELKLFLEKYNNYSVFEKIAIDYTNIKNLELFFNSIKLSDVPSEGLEKFLIYLKDNPEFEQKIDYIDRLLTFFKNEFQLINRIYLYLNDNNLILNEELKKERENLLSLLSEYFNTFNKFDEINEKWNVFFEHYFNFYSEEHEKYYSSDIFYLKEQILNLEEFKILMKISQFIPDITFKYDFYDIRSEINKLPKKCNSNLFSSLFSSPICNCGFIPGAKLPEININYVEMINSGIKNFLKELNKPENKEKIETFLLTENDYIDYFEKLLFIKDIDNINISLILPYLDDKILEIIAKALKGKWKVKKIDINEIIDKLKGKRFKQAEIKEYFNKIFDDEPDTIFWIIDSEKENNLYFKENFSKYKLSGEKLFKKYIFSGESEINLEELDLKNFSNEELFNFLKNEKIEQLKTSIRNEIIMRILYRNEKMDFERFNDIIFDYIDSLNYLTSVKSYNNPYEFKDFLAPANILLEKLKYENKINNYFDKKYLEIALEKFIEAYKNFEKSLEFKNVIKLNEIENYIENNVFIFDGLRIDLWWLIKNVLLKEGFKISEKILLIDGNTLTYNFREKLNKDILVWGEHITGKREFKKLKDKIVNFNFIDVKIHHSTIDFYPLCNIIIDEFKKGIIPLLKNFTKFIIISDHGFIETKNIKNRYTHGGNSLWEKLVPFANITL